MQARGGGGRRAQELASTIRVVEHAKGHARARVAGRVVAAWLACHSEWGAGQQLGRTATQADAELSRSIGTAWCDGSVRKEFESRLPPTHCDPWKSEQVPSTVPSLAIDMHDVLLAHQPQPELAKHVPQDGRLSHPALAASTCANASRAVLKPMTGHTGSERGRREVRHQIRTMGRDAIDDNPGPPMAGDRVYICDREGTIRSHTDPVGRALGAVQWFPSLNLQCPFAAAPRWDASSQEASGPHWCPASVRCRGGSREGAVGGGGRRRARFSRSRRSGRRCRPAAGGGRRRARR